MKSNWYIEESFFSKKEVNDINKIVQNKFEPNLKDIPADTSKICEVKVIFAKHLKKYLNIIDDKINEINTLHFGFNMTNYFDYDWINHNTYKAKDKGEYDWHIDLNDNKMYDLKFTCLVNVSEQPYTGGDFYLMLSKMFNLKPFHTPGSLLIFPSFFLHKVDPVLSGERKTLIFFKKGPLWR
jgi:predicted 2-oxoglutarate/Fe(II)-dependent dioxygenase YbiX